MTNVVHGRILVFVRWVWEGGWDRGGRRSGRIIQRLVTGINLIIIIKFAGQ